MYIQYEILIVIVFEMKTRLLGEIQAHYVLQAVAICICRVIAVFHEEIQ